MRSMRRYVMKWVLILWVATQARDVVAFECRRRLLTPDEQRGLAAYVLESRGIALDSTSIVACRNWDTVIARTVRAPQADGSERYASLSCWLRRRSAPDSWQCTGEPIAGFRIDTHAGELGVWVGIETPTALGLARRLAERGIELLGRDGALPYCGGGPRSETRTLASLRRELTGGDGIIMLVRELGRFSLSGGDQVVVRFALDPADNVTVNCWYLQEIIVTG